MIAMFVFLDNEQRVVIGERALGALKRGDLVAFEVEKDCIAEVEWQAIYRQHRDRTGAGLRYLMRAGVFTVEEQIDAGVSFTERGAGDKDVRQSGVDRQTVKVVPLGLKGVDPSEDLGELARVNPDMAAGLDADSPIAQARNMLLKFEGSAQVGRRPTHLGRTIPAVDVMKSMVDG